MITLPYEIVYESVTFIFLGGKLPTSLLNVTRLPKRSPTDLSLVKEQYRVDNTKSLCGILIISTTKHHSPRYNTSPNINNPNSAWNEAYSLCNFSQVTNKLPSSTLNKPCSTEAFNSIRYSTTEIKNSLYYPFWNCKVMGVMGAPVSPCVWTS